MLYAILHFKLKTKQNKNNLDLERILLPREMIGNPKFFWDVFSKDVGSTVVFRKHEGWVCQIQLSHGVLPT